MNLILVSRELWQLCSRLLAPVVRHRECWQWLTQMLWSWTWQPSGSKIQTGRRKPEITWAKMLKGHVPSTSKALSRHTGTWQPRDLGQWQSPVYSPWYSTAVSTLISTSTSALNQSSRKFLWLMNESMNCSIIRSSKKKKGRTITSTVFHFAKE